PTDAPAEKREPWPGYQAWLDGWIAWHRALPAQSFSERLAASQPYMPPNPRQMPLDEQFIALEAEAQFNVDLIQLVPPMPPPSPWRDVVERIRCPMLLLLGDVNRGGM